MWREPCVSECRLRDGMRACAEPSPAREGAREGEAASANSNLGRKQKTRNHANKTRHPSPHMQTQIQFLLKSEARKLDRRKGGKKQKAASGT